MLTAKLRQSLSHTSYVGHLLKHCWFETFLQQGISQSVFKAVVGLLLLHGLLLT